MQKKEVAVLVLVVTAIVLFSLQPGLFDQNRKASFDVQQKPTNIQRSPFHAPFNALTGRQAQDPGVPCEETYAPGCGGYCPDGQVCMYAGMPNAPIDAPEYGCGCVSVAPPKPPCEQSFPACDGVCDNPEETCVNCACVSASSIEPCENSAPNCDGYCLRQGDLCVGCGCIPLSTPQRREPFLKGPNDEYKYDEPLEHQCGSDKGIVLTKLDNLRGLPVTRASPVAYFEKSLIHDAPLGVVERKVTVPTSPSSYTIFASVTLGITYLAHLKSDSGNSCQPGRKVQVSTRTYEYPCAPGTFGCSNPRLPTENIWKHMNMDIFLPDPLPLGFDLQRFAMEYNANPNFLTANGRCAYLLNGRPGSRWCWDATNLFVNDARIGMGIKTGFQLINLRSLTREQIDQLHTILRMLSGTENYLEDEFFITEDYFGRFIADIRLLPVGRPPVPGEPNEAPLKTSKRYKVFLNGGGSPIVGPSYACFFEGGSTIERTAPELTFDNIRLWANAWDFRCVSAAQDLSRLPPP